MYQKARVILNDMETINKHISDFDTIIINLKYAYGDGRGRKMFIKTTNSDIATMIPPINVNDFVEFLKTQKEKAEKERLDLEKEFAEL